MTEELTKGLRKREAWLIGLVRFGIVLTVAMAGCNIALMLFLHWVETGAFASSVAQDTFAEVIDLTRGVVGVAYLLFFVGAVIAYGYWVNRAARVAASRSPEIMTISPGWAFGWNFIPIATLWMPFRAVAQAWRAGGGAGAAKEPLPGVFYLWWLPWLVTNMVSHVSFRLGGGLDPSFEQLKLATRLDLASDVLMLLACYGLIKVVQHVRRRLGEADQAKVAVFE